jgi:hypothetical protein
MHQHQPAETEIERRAGDDVEFQRVALDERELRAALAAKLT